MVEVKTAVIAVVLDVAVELIRRLFGKRRKSRKCQEVIL